MQNREVAHKFFYDVNGSFDRRSMTVSYEYNKYYSYGTVIGKLTEDINGRTVCIISNNNFSMTTAKHLSELRQACPFPIYYLPQRMYNKDFYVEEIIEQLKQNLDYYSKAKLTQKPNREGFNECYAMLTSTLELAMFEEHFKQIKSILKEFESIHNAINNPEELKKINELIKQKELKKQQKLKRELKKYTDKYDVAELACVAYSYNSDIDKEVKTKLKQLLNPKNELSFVWFEGEKVKTSQSITVDKKEATTLLKLWQNGKLKHGMTISYYTVLEVKNDYIKIGCHKIPTTNLQALLSQLNTKQVA
jgi:hypothetical protein